MMRKTIADLQDRSVSLLQRITQLDTEPAQNVPLAQIVLDIGSHFDLLLVAANAYSGCVGCRPRLLDLRKELMAFRQRPQVSE